MTHRHKWSWWSGWTLDEAGPGWAMRTRLRDCTVAGCEAHELQTRMARDGGIAA